MKKKYPYWIFCCFLFLALSCRRSPESEPGFDLYGKDLPGTLAAYNDLKTGAGQHQKAGVPAMYVDFSAGMYTAFGTPVIKALMSQCFNTVLDRQFEVYKLAEGKVTPIQVDNSTQLGQVVGDPKQYLDIRAPIQAAVEKIVASKNDALLITDFEEWQDNTEVTNVAYLKISFSKWLKDGNSISFFIADYQEGAVAKHIYFTVFTYGRPYGSSLIDKLRARLNVLPAHFDLATDAYSLYTDYPGGRTGGIFRDAGGKDEKSRNVLDLQPEYINGLAQHRPLEYYPLGLSWATIAEIRKDYQQQNQFNELFRHLFIDLSNNDSYTFGELEVNTYDATADFERFARSIEVRKHVPAIVKGRNGESEISDKEADPIALNCYNADGSVKTAYVYKPLNVPILNELFVLNQSLFSNTFKTDPRNTEIGVSFGPQFDAGKIPDPAGLMRITISVKQASVNATGPVPEKFKWVNRNGVLNSGLYESVKSTLEELKPKDKTIYTIYIKTTEQ